MKIKIQALVKVIEFIPRSNGPEFKSKTWQENWNLFNKERKYLIVD